ncbi:MAG TPA: PCYCGC motif-containing (lipo)protein [Terriglobales bacterium]|nr:PCYCGC motif-containing (lipo)protein [Terriglobales bacterium]
MRKQVVLSLFLVLVALSLSAQWNFQESADPGDIPAYHATPPKKGEKLPPLLPKEALLGPEYQYPFQSHAYELAPKISSVIYQQPCYCHCDRMGHQSLRSCYEGTHAANCGACLKELYYSYEMHKKGNSAKQIRKGIIAGEWKQIDLQTAASIN